MTYQQWAESFAIFAKYKPDNAYGVSAEHDVIYAGGDISNIPDAEKEQLDKLGWIYDDRLDCWKCFV